MITLPLLRANVRECEDGSNKDCCIEVTVQMPDECQFGNSCQTIQEKPLYVISFPSEMHTDIHRPVRVEKYLGCSSCCILYNQTRLTEK